MNEEAGGHIKQAAINLGLGEEVSDGAISEEIKHYAKALYQWAVAGFPRRDNTQIQICHEQCVNCKYSKNAEKAGWAKRLIARLGLISNQTYCTLCGCAVSPKRGLLIVNKAAMATEHCPHPEGDKWAAALANQDK